MIRWFTSKLVPQRPYNHHEMTINKTKTTDDYWGGRENKEIYKKGSRVALFYD